MLHSLVATNILFENIVFKIDGRYPNDTGVTLSALPSPGNPLRYHPPRSVLPVSVLTHSRGRSASHQSHVFERGDKYGQVQVCSKGRQGSRVDRPLACQPSVGGQVLAFFSNTQFKHRTKWVVLHPVHRLGTFFYLGDNTVASREIETTVFDPASVFLSTH